MKKQSKRLGSLLMAACMFFTLLPAAAWAADVPEAGAKAQATATPELAAAIVQSAGSHPVELTLTNSADYNANTGFLVYAGPEATTTAASVLVTVDLAQQKLKLTPAENAYALPSSLWLCAKDPELAESSRVRLAVVDESQLKTPQELADYLNFCEPGSASLAGSTVTQLKNAELKNGLIFKGSFNGTWALNGKTISLTEEGTAIADIRQNTCLTLQGGTLTATGSNGGIASEGTLTARNVTVNAGENSALMVTAGTAVIEGGSYTSVPPAPPATSVATLMVAGEASVTVKSATFRNTASGGYAYMGEKPLSALLASGSVSTPASSQEVNFGDTDRPVMLQTVKGTLTVTAPAALPLENNILKAYSVGSTYDIHGVGAAAIQTTYNNYGYAAYLSTTANPQTSYDAKSITTNGTASTAADGKIKVNTAFEFVNRGKYLQVTYTLENLTDADIPNVSLGVCTDVQIGGDDSASIYSTPTGFRMVNHYGTSDPGYGKQFTLACRNASGVLDNADTLWFGGYSSRKDNLFKNTTDDKLEGRDSGLAFSWKDRTLPANGELNFSVLFSVDTIAAPPEVPGDANAFRLYIYSAELEEDGLIVNAQVKDAAGVRDTLYYRIDGGDEKTMSSVIATGQMMNIAGLIPTSEFSEGEHQIEIWMQNSKGAMSASVTKTVTKTTDGFTGEDITAGNPPLLPPTTSNGGSLTENNLATDVDTVFGGAAELTEDGKIVLNRDVILTDSITVETGVELDLNGHTITGPTGADNSAGETGNGKPAFEFGTGGSLELGNSKETGGLIIGGDGGNGGADSSVGGNGGSAVNTGSTGGSLTVGEGVTLIGGNGGNASGSGSSGGNGGSAVAGGGSSEVTINGSASGGNGGDGVGTGNGGNGGSGVSTGGNINVSAGSTISGGQGGNSAAGTGGSGGAGSIADGNVVNAGTTTGGSGGQGAIGGNGGAGAESTGGNVTVNNGGQSSGGSGGTGSTTAGSGGAGASANGTTTIENGAQTSGGQGGGSSSGVAGPGGQGSVSGGNITTGGTTIGGNGGQGQTGGSGGAGVESTGGNVTVNNGGQSSGGGGGTGSTTAGNGGAGTSASGTTNVAAGGTTSGGTGGNSSSGIAGDGGQGSVSGGNITTGGTTTGGNGGQGQTGGSGSSGAESTGGNVTVNNGGQSSGGSGGTGSTTAGNGGAGTSASGTTNIATGGTTAGGNGGNSATGAAGNGGAGSTASGDIVSTGTTTGGSGGSSSGTGGTGGSGASSEDGDVTVNAGGQSNGGTGGVGNVSGGQGGNGSESGKGDTSVAGSSNGGNGGNGASSSANDSAGNGGNGGQGASAAENTTVTGSATGGNGGNGGNASTTAGQGGNGGQGATSTGSGTVTVGGNGSTGAVTGGNGGNGGQGTTAGGNGGNGGNAINGNIAAGSSGTAQGGSGGNGGNALTGGIPGTAGNGGAAVPDGSASIPGLTVKPGKPGQSGIVTAIQITITRQPKSLTTVTVGQIQENLTVEATVNSGAAPAYQWYSCQKADKTGAQAIPGAATASFSLPKSLEAGNYYYFCRISGAGAGPVDSDVAMVTVIVKPVQPTTGSLTGSVKDTTGAALADVTIEIRKGSNTVGSTVTDVQGNFRIDNLNYGVYTLSASKDGQKLTFAVRVNSALVVQNLIFQPNQNTKTEVEVKGETPPAAAGNLDEMFTSEDAALAQTGATVEIKLVVEQKTESQIPGDAAVIHKNLGKMKLGFYLDAKLLKSITGSGTGDFANREIQPPQGKAVHITLDLPNAIQNKAPYSIIRIHEGAADILAADYDAVLQTISFDADKFSTYAIAYTPTSDEPLDVSTGSAFHGNLITATAGEGGTISPAGEIVVRDGESQRYVITAKEGYRLHSLLVDGKEAVLTDGAYTFNEVWDTHTIAAAFTKTAADSASPGAGAASTEAPSTANPKTGDGSYPWQRWLLPTGILAFWSALILRKKGFGNKNKRALSITH